MCMENFDGGRRKPMLFRCPGSHGVCLGCVPALRIKWAAEQQSYLAALEVPENERSFDQKCAAAWPHAEHASKKGWLECPTCSISVPGDPEELVANAQLIDMIEALSKQDEALEYDKQQQVQGFGLKASIKNVLYVRPRPQTVILSCCSWHLCCSFSWYSRGSWHVCRFAGKGF